MKSRCFKRVAVALMVLVMAFSLAPGWNPLNAYAEGTGQYYELGPITVGSTGSFSVTYQADDADRGTVPVDNGSYAYDDTVTVLGNTGGLERTGYTFKGWKKYVGEITVVTYDANAEDIIVNSTLNDIYATSDEVTVRRSQWTRAQYEFTGWNTEPDGSGTDYTEDDTFTADDDLSLYAQWERIPTMELMTLVITHDDYADNKVKKDDVIKYTATVTNPSGGIEQEEVKLGLGLVLMSGGSEIPYSDYNDYITLTPGTNTSLTGSIASTDDIIKNNIGMMQPGEEFVLEFTVKVNASTGLDRIEPQGRLTYYTPAGQAGGPSPGGSVTIPPGTDDDTVYIEGDEVRVLGNITFVAQWEPVLYTVTFESNGGTSVASQPGIPYGGKAVKPDAPTRKGYTFNGWYLDNRTFTNKWDFNTNTVTEDITLYAKWTYTSTGGGGGSDPSPTPTPTPTPDPTPAPSPDPGTNPTSPDNVPDGIVAEPTDREGVYRFISEDGTPLGYFIWGINDQGEETWIAIDENGVPLGMATLPKTYDYGDNKPLLLMGMAAIGVLALALYRKRKRESR